MKRSSGLLAMVSVPFVRVMTPASPGRPEARHPQRHSCGPQLANHPSVRAGDGGPGPGIPTAPRVYCTDPVAAARPARATDTPAASTMLRNRARTGCRYAHSRIAGLADGARSRRREEMPATYTDRTTVVAYNCRVIRIVNGSAQECGRTARSSGSGPAPAG